MSDLCSPAGVTMSLLGEVFPHAYKPAGFTIACSINWLFLFLVGMLFPLIVVRLLGPKVRNSTLT